MTTDKIFMWNMYTCEYGEFPVEQLRQKGWRQLLTPVHVEGMCAMYDKHGNVQYVANPENHPHLTHDDPVTYAERVRRKKAALDRIRERNEQD